MMPLRRGYEVATYDWVRRSGKLTTAYGVLVCIVSITLSGCMATLAKQGVVYEQRREMHVDPIDVRRSEKILNIIQLSTDSDHDLVVKLIRKDYCSTVVMDRKVSTGWKTPLSPGAYVCLTPFIAPLATAEFLTIVPIIIDASLAKKIKENARAGKYVKDENVTRQLQDLQLCATQLAPNEKLEVVIPQIHFRQSFSSNAQGLVRVDVTQIPGLIPMGEDIVITLASVEQPEVRQEINLKGLMASGRELLARGQVDEAIQNFRASTFLNPRYLPARNALIAALQRQGDLTGAEREATASLQMWPDDTQVILTLASLYRQQNRLIEAFREIERVHRRGSLITALEAEDPFVRKTVAWALGEMKEPAAVELLMVALKSKYQDVQEEARSALPKIEGPWAVEPLIAALSDAHPYIRTVAAQTLGRIADLRAVEPLTTALKDRDPSVRQEAVWALRKTAGARAAEALIPALRDESPSVRKMVAQALGELKVSRAVASLTVGLKDKDRDVRQAAAEALAKILE